MLPLSGFPLLKNWNDAPTRMSTNLDDVCIYLVAINVKQDIQLSLTNRATHLYKCNGMGGLLKHAPPHVCYHAEFGRSALKDVGINTGEPRKLGSAETPLSWNGRRGWVHVSPRHMLGYHVKFDSSAIKVYK